jgi:hypothetical protein
VTRDTLSDQMRRVESASQVKNYQTTSRAAYSAVIDLLRDARAHDLSHASVWYSIAC